MISRASAIFIWLTRHRLLVLAVVTIAFFGAYLPGVEMEATVFADSAGRWMQIQGLIQQNYGSLECAYDTAFDPEFRFRPGPWYFFWLQNDSCFYFYPVAYAFAAAPFVQAAPDYGYFILHLLLLLVFVFACAKMCGYILEDPSAELFGGLIALLVIPAPTFAYELSDMMMAMALFALALLCAVRGLDLRAPAFGPDTNEHRRAPQPNAKYLLASGLLFGIAFALRTEALLMACATAGAMLVLAMYQQRAAGDFRVADAFAFLIGAALSFAPVMLWQLSFYGDPLGSRGAAHADIVAGELSVQQRLDIIYTLLFGGSLGLFSALPSAALAFLWLVFPGARRACGAVGWFVFPLCGAYSLAVLLSAPNDGGYAWSPRYLAPMLTALYAGILTIVYRWGALRRRWVWRLIILGLCLHAVQFTHQGMQILQQTSRQNLSYSRAIQELNVDYVIFDTAPTIGFLSEDIIDSKRLYMALNDADAQALVDRLRATGVERWLYLRTPFGPPVFQANMAVSNPRYASGAYASVLQQNVQGMQIHLMQWQSSGTAAQQPGGSR